MFSAKTEARRPVFIIMSQALWLYKLRVFVAGVGWLATGCGENGFIARPFHGVVSSSQPATKSPTASTRGMEIVNAHVITCSPPVTDDCLSCHKRTGDVLLGWS